jgi:hypothetical protein
MSLPRIILFLILANGFLIGAAQGGSIRYDLPELLGQHYYGAHGLGGVGTERQTDFIGYSVTKSRLVIEGTIHPGKARGDGIFREPVEFDLIPIVGFSVGAIPGLFSPSVSMRFDADHVNLGPVLVDHTRILPFRWNITELYDSSNDPPLLFGAELGLFDYFPAPFPAKIVADGEPYYLMDGIIIDVPAYANITNAYVEFFLDSELVPEPSTAAATISAALLLLFQKGRMKSRHHRSG